MDGFSLSSEYPYLFYRGKPYEYEVGKGWDKICSEAFRKIANAYIENGEDLTAFSLFQIKEKFGGLRIYFEAHPQSVSKFAAQVISDAERESYTVCEICGEKGELREDLSWISTLCDEHYEESSMRIRGER